jgi:hypothetical protein
MLLWLQRSRIDWLREGDQNMKFFHQKAVRRAQGNKILKLRDDNGVVNIVPCDMQRMTMSYFQSLYTKDPTLDHSNIAELLHENITQDMNNQLCEEFTSDEITDALFQIGPLKALGPDGFPARFYEWNWELMREDIIVAVNEFFAIEYMLMGPMIPLLFQFLKWTTRSA